MGERPLEYVDTEGRPPVDREEQLRGWRKEVALEAHLSEVDAEVFSVGRGDIELLRRLAEQGCDPITIAGIVN